jgi:protein-S-isoprenylcysteine O-methyltransferase Ste14
VPGPARCRSLDAVRRITIARVRNPIRLKNLRLRFVPVFVAGALLLVFARPGFGAYLCGVVLIALGAVLRGWGAGHLVKTTRLTVSGPYAHLRHPLYLGTLLAGAGVAVMAGGWWAVAVLAVFVPWFFLDYFPRKERTESGRLEALYGEGFRAYRDAVPALLPRVAAWQPVPSTRELAGPARRWSLSCYSDNNELGTLLGLVALVAIFGVRLAWVASCA